MAAEPARPEPVLHNGRGHNSERPAYRKKKKKCLPSALTSLGFCFDCFISGQDHVTKSSGKTVSGDAHPKSIFSWDLAVVGYKVAHRRADLTIHLRSHLFILPLPTNLAGLCGGLNQNTLTHQWIAVMYSVFYVPE